MGARVTTVAGMTLARRSWRFATVLTACTAALSVPACGRASGDRALAASNEADGSTAGNVRKGCAQRFDEAVDYFPDKVSIEDAGNFAVEYHKSYKIVTVRETFLGGPPERYVLLQCGAPRPRLDAALSTAQVVSVPIASLFAASTTHVPPLVALDRLDVLTGVSKVDSIVSPPVVDRIKSGDVAEFAPLGVIDEERVGVNCPWAVLREDYN